MVARDLTKGYEAEFLQADLNRFATYPNEFPILARYDIVLALAVAHKLEEPEDFLRAAAGRSNKWLVFRAPFKTADWPHFRRDNRLIDTIAILSGRGFTLDHEAPGPRDEWTGIFRRT